MEDRLVPATFTVTTAVDAGTGSLRDAITQANANPGADTITFDPVAFATPQTISLLTALPTISDSVAITGPALVNGQPAVTIEPNAAAGAIRVFNINGPGVLTVGLSNMTIAGGRTTATGAGIQNADETVTLNNTVLTGNSASSDGGAIYSYGGSVTLSNSILVGNTASRGGGVKMESGTVVISSCTIANNSANFGGGVFADSGSALTMTGVSVASNAAVSGGAGIYLRGATSAAVNGCDVTGNTAGGGAGIVFYLCNNITISDTTIAGNTAGLRGGGMEVSDLQAAMTVSDSTISGNSSGFDGGGIFFQEPGPASSTTIRNSTITGNTTSSSGGAIGLRSLTGTFKVQNSTISGNTSLTVDSAAGYGGGGISATSATAPATILLQSTILAHNTATNGRPDLAIISPAVVTADHSIIGVADTGFTLSATSTANQTGTAAAPLDPLLGPLADNGGPTKTMAPKAGSPALNAGSNPAGLSTDQRGQTRTVGPAPDIGAYEYQPLTVANVQINDGSAQRSEVRSLTVTFSGPVSFANGNAAAAFQLEHVQDSTDINDLAAAVSTNGSGATVVTLTFTTTGNLSTEIDPVSAQNGGMASLADGRYQLTVLASDVSDAALGWALDGDANGVPGGNFVSPTDTLGGGPGQLHLYRLFGDADGDGIVDQVDLGQFRSTFNANASNPNYLAYLDADNSGAVDQVDLGQFRSRFNTNVFGPQTPSAAPTPPKVASVEVNDGSAERSEVRSITVTFSGPVLFAGGNADAAAAFHLDHLTDSNDVALAAAVSTNGQGQTVVTLTFSGAETDPLSSENGGMASLADGRYTLTVLSANVTGANGLALNGGGADGNYVSPADTLGGGPGELHLFRLFGDVNGDGIVDQTDLGLFRSSFDAGIGNPLYLSYLDADNSGVVDALDLGQFRSRFNTSAF